MLLKTAYMTKKPDMKSSETYQDVKLVDKDLVTNFLEYCYVHDLPKNSSAIGKKSYKDLRKTILSGMNFLHKNK